MAEPTVQVPVSLIERTATEYERDGWPLAAEKWRALLSQPTQAAEPKTRQQRAQEVIDRNERNRLRSAPPSIADMVPGTTFWASEVCGDDQQFQIGEGGRILPSLFWTVESHNIDPATIRDVTPPSTESTK